MFKYASEMPKKLERIAMTLERIASALEEMNRRKN